MVVDHIKTNLYSKQGARRNEICLKTPPFSHHIYAHYIDRFSYRTSLFLMSLFSGQCCIDFSDIVRQKEISKFLSY